VVYRWRVTTTSPAPSASRLLSLDTFRGLTVAGMVVVNNPGTWRAVYPPLRHADWHGWTLTDLVFPFFLFIVGVAVPLALEPRTAQAGYRSVMVRVLRRSALIFALGIVLNGFPWFQWGTLRIPGVLQRIAVCYLLAALLYLVASWRVNAVITAALLLGYWIAMTVVPVPDYGPGDLSKEGSLAAYLDRAILGPHLWQAARVYDPEGILSTAPALATTLLGVLAGVWLRSGRPPRVIVGGMAVAGAIGVGLGQVWGWWFPVNKALWTSSYVLLTGGFALLVLAALYWLIEMRGYRRWAMPFVVFGVNALILYFLSSLMARLLLLVRVADGSRLHAWLFDRFFAPWATPINASLAYALVYLALWWVVMWMMYRRGIRVRI
jgi:predicted acyltransferase